MLSREHCIRARSLRIEREGGVYHVINRGNYRQDLFVNEGAHQSFETCLFEACEKSGWVLEALLERGLRAARQTERSAHGQKKSEAWKIWVAQELKRRTNAPNAWIAKRLHLGLPQAVTVHVGRFASKGGDASEAYQKFIQRFTKCPLFRPLAACETIGAGLPTDTKAHNFHPMLISLIGYCTLLAFAWLCSSSRKNINWRTVIGAIGIQFGFGALVLYVPFGKAALEKLSMLVSTVIAYGDDGINFLFGGLSDPSQSLGFIFAFKVLPVIIFFSSLISVLYYIKVMPLIVQVIGGGIRKLLGTSRAESLSATANIFVGQTEAPLAIKPYLGRMTQSEFFAVMVGGMASIAGSVLAGYAAMGIELRFLLAACFMAAPAGLLFAKLLLPETETADNSKLVEDHADRPANVFDAAAGGASDGLKLALNVGAMLLAFIGLIALLNGVLGWVGGLFNYDALGLQLILGWLFSPVAWLLGIPWEQATLGGSFIGQKLVVNEFVAFIEFGLVQDMMSSRSQAIITFALCGFANFSSIAILLGGLGSLIPSRRQEIARLGLKAVLAGTLANLSSAAIAGILLQ